MTVDIEQWSSKSEELRSFYDMIDNQYQDVGPDRMREWLRECDEWSRQMLAIYANSEEITVCSEADQHYEFLETMLIPTITILINEGTCPTCDQCID